jgi:hypothetical protein
MVASAGLQAQQAASIAISVKGHHFLPGEVHAPANRPLTAGSNRRAASTCRSRDSRSRPCVGVEAEARLALLIGRYPGREAFCARPGSITPDTAAIAIESHISPKT